MEHKYNTKILNASFVVYGRRKKSMRESLSPFDILVSSEKADRYGEGELIESFQQDLADYLGKEAALFFPSGTMAQQIALRIYCDRQSLKKVAYHPTCHLEIHEEKGLFELHGIESVLLGDEDKLFDLSHLKSMGEVSAVLFELPQREIGAIVPKWEDFLGMIDYCQSEGVYLHLDGARLFEILPYYKKSAKQISEFFDSVYISFYKGLGSIAGAMLAGDKEFIEEARIWKQRYGGNLVHLYPYLVPAKYAFETEVQRMATFWNCAVEYAALLNTVEGVKTVPEVPVCNTFHVHFDYSAEKVLDALEWALDREGVGLLSANVRELGDNKSKVEVYMADNFEIMPKMQLNNAIKSFAERLKI